MYLFITALFAASALFAGPAAADLPADQPAAPSRPLPTEHRLTDADCTCVYDAPIPSVGDASAWALRAPNGCARPCKELPGYDELMSHLTSLAESTDAPADPHHHAMAPNFSIGVGPWTCSDKTGSYSSGSFFISCDDALRYERYVYCHAGCGCQISLENAVANANCPTYHSNCGTNCVCLDGNNWNPFSGGCDCDGLSDPYCKGVYDNFHHCLDLQKTLGNSNSDPTCNADFPAVLKQFGCEAHNGSGINPGNYNFPPDKCWWDEGCNVALLNTAGNSSHLCPPAPSGPVPPIETGTTGIP